MVGLGRVELPTNGLGIGRLFLNVHVFSAFSLANFVLFWAHSGAERATDLATSKLRDVPYLRAGDPSHQRLIRFIRSVIPEDPSQPAVSLRLFLS